MAYKEIIIIGGGLGGLIASHQLAKAGREVLVIEKKRYPFHRVCGEYISNEVKDFLTSEGLFPKDFSPSNITQFELGSIKGNLANIPLDLGGFGISRYVLDRFIFEKCQKEGAEFMLQVQVEEASYNSEVERFEVLLSDGRKLECKYLIGAFGKRSKLDKSLDRKFMQKRSPFIGVKYHIQTDFDADKVALYNFKGGYCGINQIEEGKFNLCYLGNSKHLKKHGSIAALEENVLCKNPQLHYLFNNSDFLFERPEVINEISFEPKPLIENHILMLGDAAGLITPLCGNGMAMAIHSAKILSECLLKFSDRNQIEKEYLRVWNKNFKSRLWIGRRVQWLFGSNAFSELSVSLIKNNKLLATQIIKRTHGDVIEV